MSILGLVMTTPSPSEKYPLLKTKLNATVGLWTLDCKKQILSFDASAQAILGKTPGNTTTTMDSFSRKIYPENISKLKAQFFEFIKENNHFLSQDYLIETKQGERI